MSSPSLEKRLCNLYKIYNKLKPYIGHPTKSRKMIIGCGEFLRFVIHISLLDFSLSQTRMIPAETRNFVVINLVAPKYDSKRLNYSVINLLVQKFQHNYSYLLLTQLGYFINLLEQQNKFITIFTVVPSLSEFIKLFLCLVRRINSLIEKNKCTFNFSVKKQMYI